MLCLTTQVQADEDIEWTDDFQDAPLPPVRTVKVSDNNTGSRRDNRKATASAKTSSHNGTLAPVAGVNTSKKTRSGSAAAAAGAKTMSDTAAAAADLKNVSNTSTKKAVKAIRQGNSSKDGAAEKPANGEKAVKSKAAAPKADAVAKAAAPPGGKQKVKAAGKRAATSSGKRYKLLEWRNLCHIGDLRGKLLFFRERI